MRCVVVVLERIERATAELLFNAIDEHFQESTTALYDNLVGLGRVEANEMFGARNSLMSWLQCKLPALVALHCHCHIAALNAKRPAKSGLKN